MKMISIFALICAFILIAGAASRAEDLRVSSLIGTLEKVRIGMDSFEIVTKNEKGELISFLMTGGAYEWMTQEQRKELEKIKNGYPGRRWPGKTWPNITDRYSKIRVWYIEKPFTFLSYEVLQKTKSLWISIIACTEEKREAFDIKNKALLQKFDTCEIIDSSQYKSLKAGFQVVVIGAFTSREEALDEMNNAKRKGWKDAYVKKLW